jgi:hypothetical protein
VRRLLYHTPEYMAIDEDAIDALGLGLSIGGCGYAFCRLLGPGPSGRAGCVFAAYPLGETVDASGVGYFADRQTWVEVSAGRLWIGYANDGRPGPEDLKRPNPIQGHHVRLSDRKAWLVPAVRAARGSSAIPQGIALGPDGELVVEDLPQYAELAAGADRLWDWVWGRLNGLPYTELIRTVGTALSLNYRVGPLECSALRLLTTANVAEAGRAVVDWPTVVELLGQAEAESKKNEILPDCDGSDTGSGVTGDSPDTVPPTPTLVSTGSSEAGDG